MAIADEKDGKVWGLFKLPFRNAQSTTTSRSSSHNTLHYRSQQHQSLGNTSLDDGSVPRSNSSSSVSSVARSLLPARRRLKLDPSNKLYFPYEPGKQVRSAIKIKLQQVSRSFQVPNNCTQKLFHASSRSNSRPRWEHHCNRIQVCRASRK